VLGTRVALDCAAAGHDGTMVTVRYWAGARAAAGRAEEAVDAGTVGELLGAIGSRPPLARVLGASSLLVDGTAVRRDDEGYPLAAGAVVDVLPPFAGG
jgi:molybdopterin synthase sulfur carrier subunit